VNWQLETADCANVCGFWVEGLSGVVLCVTTSILVLVATVVDVVVGAWLIGTETDVGEEILLMMKGKEY
jgi:hypothetical protein